MLNDLRELQNRNAEYIAGARNYYAVCSVDNSGDYRGNDAINRAIADGQTSIYIRNGTYKLTLDVVLLTGMTIIGESLSGVILDCGYNSVQITGTGTTRTVGAGTITVTNGDATVTGSGTTFTNYTAGDYIVLPSTPNTGVYKILSITNDTALELTYAFQGPTGAGIATWAVYNFLENIRLANFTFQNSNINTSTEGAIDFNGVKSSCIDNVFVQNIAYASANPFGISLANSPLCLINQTSVKNSDSHGISFSGLGTMASRIFNTEVNNCGGGGIALNGCQTCGFSMNQVHNNIGQAFEVTNAAHRNVIHQNQVFGNLSFGVGIVAGCSYNVITSNVVFNNNAVWISDGGTGTVTDNNITS